MGGPLPTSRCGTPQRALLSPARSDTLASRGWAGRTHVGPACSHSRRGGRPGLPPVHQLHHRRALRVGQQLADEPLVPAPVLRVDVVERKLRGGGAVCVCVCGWGARRAPVAREQAAAAAWLATMARAASQRACRPAVSLQGPQLYPGMLACRLHEAGPACHPAPAAGWLSGLPRGRRGRCPGGHAAQCTAQSRS